MQAAHVTFWLFRLQADAYKNAFITELNRVAPSATMNRDVLPPARPSQTVRRPCIVPDPLFTVNATIFDCYGDEDDFLDCFIMPAHIVGGTFQGGIHLAKSVAVIFINFRKRKPTAVCSH